jgi:hypothetical protein
MPGLGDDDRLNLRSPLTSSTEALGCRLAATGPIARRPR